MKKTLSIFLLLSVLFLGLLNAEAQDIKETKTNLTSPKPIINSAIWNNTTEEEVYVNCLTALHLQGFELIPSFTSKENGLIVTGTVDYFPPFWKTNVIGGEYYLNILVYEDVANSVCIHIQINGANIFDYKPSANTEDGFTKIIVDRGTKTHSGAFKNNEIWNGLTVKISEDVEQFLLKLETLQGNAISKTTTILSWD